MTAAAPLRRDAAASRPAAPDHRETPMTLILKIIDGLCVAGAVVAGLCAAGLAAMLIVEVVTTSFFTWSQPWAVEYSGYLLAATRFCGSGWTLRDAGHVRVQVLTNLLPAGAHRIADAIGTAFALGVAGFAAWAVTDYAIRSYGFGSTSVFPTRTPLVYPQGLLAAGLTILALGLLARLIRLVMGAAPETAGAEETHV